MAVVGEGVEDRLDGPLAAAPDDAVELVDDEQGGPVTALDRQGDVLGTLPHRRPGVTAVDGPLEVAEQHGRVVVAGLGAVPRRRPLPGAVDERRLGRLPEAGRGGDDREPVLGGPLEEPLDATADHRGAGSGLEARPGDLLA